MTTTLTEPCRTTALILDGVEELDAIGPWEVLRTWQATTERDVAVRTTSLDGLAATSRRGILDELRQRHPGVDVRADQRWVDAGRVVTSAGVSAGIDMALHLVERLESADVAASVARAVEYRWAPGADGSTASTPDRTSGQGS